MELSQSNSNHLKTDLLNLFLVNAIILGFLIGLFFYNRQTQFLEKWFASIF
jgi:uncharacterized membrane protein